MPAQPHGFSHGEVEAMCLRALRVGMTPLAGGLWLPEVHHGTRATSDSSGDLGTVRRSQS
jgi:hypothetical protein